MSQLKHKNYLQIQIALSKEDFDGFTVKALRNRLLQQNDEAMLYAKDRRAIYRTLVCTDPKKLDRLTEASEKESI